MPTPPTMVIRDEQVTALRRPGNEGFARELAQGLAERFPEQWADAAAPGLAEFIERTLEIALAHGLDTQHAVAAFAALRAAYGEEFERTPAAAEAMALLRDRELPGTIKIAAMQDCLRAATGR